MKPNNTSNPLHFLTNRPETIWTTEDKTRSVAKYFNIYAMEFDPDWRIESAYPYKGKAHKVFRRVTDQNESECVSRFGGKGIGCWTLRGDGIMNGRTADLLAAADNLGGNMENMYSSAFPGGIGADCDSLWVPLLDGGVGVDVIQREHQYTNRVHARQWTTIRGPVAFRVLLEYLGFDWIQRKLFGEQEIPDHERVISLINELLTREIE